MDTTCNGKRAGLNARKRQKMIFYCLLLAFPVAQFVVFYFVVNFNGIILSMQTYENGDYVYAGFSNFSTVFKLIFGDGVFKYAIINSFKLLAVDFLILIPLTLFFSFYIAKKYFFSKFFRVVLFLPTIISAIAMVLVYRYFMEEAVPEILKLISGDPEKDIRSFLFDSSFERRWIFILLYYVYMSFGTGVLLYSGAMSGISADLIEAANLDGATGIKEFWYIAVPGVWPTFIVLTLAKLTGFFTNRLNLFSFYGTSALNQNYTIGYYLFKETYGDLASMSVFPKLAAMGVVFTVIIAPITLSVKKILEKYGPRED